MMMLTTIVYTCDHNDYLLDAVRALADHFSFNGMAEGGDGKMSVRTLVVGIKPEYAAAVDALLGQSDAVSRWDDWK